MGQKDFEKIARDWLEAPYDLKTQEAVRTLMEEDPEGLRDAFYTTVAFGTGGMRAVMGVGTNRLNVYTIRNATQGLANYIRRQEEPHPKVYMSHDSRHHSRSFAEEAARVLAGNGIEVFLTEELRPTPYVSFGCRLHQCTAAIMITASHNPPEYNGYKVYWSDGAQVVPPHDRGIMEEVKKINSPKDVKLSDLKDPLIHLVDDDEAYYDALSPLQNHPETNKEKGGSLKIIYSPLHGCGIMTVPEGLRRWGFTSLSLVEKQADPNGSFPGARSPNPEQPAALKLGSAQLLKEKGDLFIATDPDADRMGVVVNHRGKAISLNGNQIASLCLFYLCNRPSLPENSAAVTTIVTTELFRKIAQAHNVTCFEVLTGFKYIGEKIHEWEHSHAHTFLFGAEESLGFLYGTHARDKDATIAACLIAEIALQLKKERKTLVDLSEELLKRFGPFLERQLSVPFGGGEKGMVTMKNIMEDLRKSPPSEIDGEKVIETEDYLTGRTREPLPRSNVFVLRMEDQTKFVIRPSGTEPKIKIYGLARYRDEAKLTAALSSIEKFLKRESP